MPQYIDNPPQVIFWEADEFVPVFMLLALGIVTRTLTLCIFASWVIYKVFVHFKNQHLRGYLWHVVYRIGLIPLNKRFPNGAIHFYHV